MVKRNLLKKICATTLALAVISGLSYVDVLGADNKGLDVLQDNNVNVECEAPAYGYVDDGYRAPSIVEGTTKHMNSNLALASELPASYDSRDYGYVTPVRHQGGWGMCWAFSTVAAMESYALAHGIETDADNIDLSEYNLAYMAYDDTSFKDVIGGTEGDYSTTEDMSYSLKYLGGNVSYAFKVLSKWGGIVNEADGGYPELYGSNSIDFVYDISKLSYILTGMYDISMKDMDFVKQAVIDNGALAVYYYDDGKYANNSYYYNYEVSESINHGVTIVGWNDNISKSNFTHTGSDGNQYTPEADGAWLIKNSWGINSSRCQDGYMWISYYDKSIVSSDATAFAVDKAGKYDYNYQYDGNTYFGGGLIYSDGTSIINTKKCANVFTVPVGTGAQNLEAVSFATRDASVGYSIQIYKNPTLNTENADGTFTGTDNPESGTPLLDTALTGTTTHAGYYTIPLNNKIKLNEGDVFAVVISFDDDTQVEYSYNNDDYIMYNSKNANNESYYSTNGSDLVDLYEAPFLGKYKINLCVKAFTTKAPTTGWVQEGDKWYFYDATGVKSTGWQKVSGRWYYFDASGVMQTGWMRLSGKWYYLKLSGDMATGWQKVSNKWYYFNTSGVMQTGWQKISNKWYYFNTSGAMQTGWKQIGDKWYYFDTKSGVMASNKWVGSYYLKSSGAMAVSEWVDGGRYYVGADGKWIKGYTEQ